MTFSLKKISLTLKISLKTKMLLLTAIIFAGFLLSTFMEIYTVTTVKIGSTTYNSIKSSKDSLENFALLKSDLNQVRAEVITLINETDRDKKEQINNAIKQLTTDINGRFADIVKLMLTEEKKVAVQDAQSTWQEFAATMDNELIPAVQRGDLAQAKNLATNVQKMRYDRFIEQIGTMVDTLKLEITEQEANTGAAIKKKVIASAVMSGIIFLAVLFAVMVVTRSVTLPMLKGVAFAKGVAAGNLSETIEVRSGDEIGDLADSLNSMVEGLNSMVARVNTSADDLTRISRNIYSASKTVIEAANRQGGAVKETSFAVHEINASIEEMAHGVDGLSHSASETSSSILEMAASIEEVALNMETLSASVEEVSSSIVEMTAAVKQIGESAQILMEAATTTASSISEMDASIKQIEGNARDTASISMSVLDDAKTGRESVEATIAGIEEIRRSSRITADVVSNLSAKAADIGAIVSVIDDVTEQTNLLALNAAIIAAQAGEHGKGFAVVADEIKELADRTRSSTSEISKVIKGVQEETAKAVKAIGIAENSIDDGAALSRKSGAALAQIVNGVKSSADQVGEIARSTVEQAKGSQMINQAMDQVAQMVNQIGSATREQGKVSDLIMTAVERMKGLTSQVRSSTREQSKVGGNIAHATENITGMINQIKVACSSQSKSSEKIVHAVENIQQSTKVNQEATTILDEAVSSLSVQVDVLQKEMGGFKVKDAG